MQAQSLAGIKLGDTVEAARALLPSRKLAPVSGRNYQLLGDNDFYAVICDGHVTHLSSTIGASIHDFANAVEKETLRRGQGLTTVVNMRASGPEASSIVSTYWDVGRNVGYEIEVWALGDGIRVTEAYSLKTSRCPFP